MHIADGILSLPVLAGGSALAFTGVGIGLAKTDYDQISQVAVLSAGFFVASLIHVPIGPGQVHLILNGLAGLILGWAVFPALFIGLLLQSLFFGYGGITALGVNTLNMALPGLIIFYIFRPLVKKNVSRRAVFSLGFACGALSITLSGLLLAASLFLANREFLGVATTLLIAHLPILIIEGILSGAAVVFLKKTTPQVLQ
jgi:cobalt/nickel transport system permease protein